MPYPSWEGAENLYKIAHTLRMQEHDRRTTPNVVDGYWCMAPESEFSKSLESAMVEGDEHKLRTLLSHHITDIRCSRCGVVIIKDVMRPETSCSQFMGRKYTCHNCVLDEIKQLIPQCEVEVNKVKGA